MAGLANLGNTCFMNALLQMVSRCRALNTLMENPEVMRRCKPTSQSTLLFLEYRALARQMRSAMAMEADARHPGTVAPIVPREFVHAFYSVARARGRTEFVPFAQHDVEECWLFLLDCFHEALSRKVQMSVRGEVHTQRDLYAKLCFDMVQARMSSDYSEMYQLFYGLQLSCLQHATDSLSSSTSLSSTSLSSTLSPPLPRWSPANAVAEPFSVLELPLPESSGASKTPGRCTLDDCMRAYLMPEQVEWDGDGHARKMMRIWSFPQMLVISLKRFRASQLSSGRNTSSLQKQQTFVDFPVDTLLDWRAFCCGYDAHTSLFRLVGVCHHSGGGLGGGHYTSTVLSEDRRQWYSCNDTQVTPLDARHAANHIVSANAYLLFFEKVAEGTKGTDSAKSATLPP